MEDQIKNRMSPANPGSQAQSQAKEIPADFNNFDDLRASISKKMEMVRNQSGGSFMPPSASARVPGASAIPDGGNEVNKAAGITNNAPISSSAEVIFEACTMARPLNQSLRKAYSIGTFYFLVGKNNTHA